MYCGGWRKYMPDGNVKPASGTQVWQPETSAIPMPALQSHAQRHRVFMTVAFPEEPQAPGEQHEPWGSTQSLALSEFSAQELSGFSSSRPRRLKCRRRATWR